MSVVGFLVFGLLAIYGIIVSNTLNRKNYVILKDNLSAAKLNKRK